MIFSLENHSFKYELEKIARLFLPFEKFQFVENANRTEEGIFTVLTDNGEAEIYVNIGGQVDVKKVSVKDLDEKGIELKMAVMLFDILKKQTGYNSPWGIVTGIRPAKLMTRLAEDSSFLEAEKYFRETLLVSDEKIKLCSQCAKSEEEIIGMSTADSFDLYISIPFCPSRCSYCSFVSHSVEQAKILIPQYIDLLSKEIEQTAEIAKKLSLKLRTVYIGGGTPTSINEEQLEKIVSAVKKNFDLSDIWEYTVEAGRPDTVTLEKLDVLKKGGVTRISINPQTMNNEILTKIGRRHTAEQTVKAFKLAREVGFDNINMDLIAGLPNEDAESFKNTIKKILELNPESVTVHSLAMKRASNLTKANMQFVAEQGGIAAEMQGYGYEKLLNNGYLPYYMYKQSKTVGNLENVGYSKKGFECLYNVFIMDETHTVLGCGASAVTKLKSPYKNKIERIFNYKYPYEYINDFETIIQRKKGIFEFYELYCQRDK